MRRRTFLTGAAVALTSSLGGCSAASNESVASPGGSEPPSPATPPATPDFGDPLETTLVGRDGYPTTYPSFRDSNRTVGYDRVDPADADLVLEPSRRRIDLGEVVGFRLENPLSRELGMNRNDWRVFKGVDGEWFYVIGGSISPWTPLGAGDAYLWTFVPYQERTEAGVPVPVTGVGSNVWRFQDRGIHVKGRGFGGGVYAFGVDGISFKSDQYGGDSAVVATFELAADELALTVTNTIERTTREGATLVAQSSRGEPDNEYFRRCAYTLEPVGSPATDPYSVITERVVRNHQLRDAIALLREHDVAEVRIEERNDVRPPFGVHDERYYEYRGTVYRVTTRELST